MLRLLLVVDVSRHLCHSFVVASPSSSGGQWLRVQIIKTIRGKVFRLRFFQRAPTHFDRLRCRAYDDWNLSEDSVSMLKGKRSGKGVRATAPPYPTKQN